MKSIMKKSLAAVMVVAMLLSMLAMPIVAATTNLVPKGENDPCEHDGNAELVKTWTVPATCVKNGGTWHECSECDIVWVTDEVAKDDTVHEDLPAEEDKFHKWSATADEGVEATCWRPGRTAGYTCENGCGKSKGAQVIPQFTHEPANDPRYPNGCLVSNITSPDCLEEGVLTYTCPFADVEAPEGETGCLGYNGEYDKVLGADGHTHSLVPTNYQAPTCLEEGYVTLECSICEEGDFKVYIAAIGHNWKEVTALAPECAVAGRDHGFYCANEWLVWTWATEEGEESSAIKVGCSAYYNVTKGEGSRTNPAYATDAEGNDLKAVPVEDDLNEKKFDLPATAGHTWVDITEEEHNGEPAFSEGQCDPNPDLAVKGWQWQQCSKCGAYDKKVVEPKHDHTGQTGTVIVGNCDRGGYTLIYCIKCKQDVQINPTSKVHKWTKNQDATKVIYVFEKNGKLYTEHMGDQTLPSGSRVTIDFAPYMVSGDKYNTDVTAQQLVTVGGYTPIILSQNIAYACGERGEYTYSCDACDEHGFIYVDIAHHWDGKWTTVTFEEKTCETEGGYWGNCDLVGCGQRFPLSADEVGDNDPDYAGPTPAIGHKWHTEALEDEKFSEKVNGVYEKPFSEKAPTCTEYGWAKFEYCDNEDCSSNLPNFEDAFEAAAKTKLEHKYFVDTFEGDPMNPALTDLIIPEGKTWMNVVYAEQPTCALKGFYVAKCSVCSSPIYNDDTINPIVNQETGARQYVPADFALKDENGLTISFGSATKQHTWDTTNRVVGTPATCTTPGQYAPVLCSKVLPNGRTCNEPRPQNVDDVIPQIVLGVKPTAEQCFGVESGAEFKDSNWIVIKTAATCLAPERIYIQCEYCYNQALAGKAVVHELELVYSGMLLGAHMIKGNNVYLTVEEYGYLIDDVKYFADATNTYVMWDYEGTKYYLVHADSLNGLSIVPTDDEKVASGGYEPVAGTCRTEGLLEAELHVDYYECGVCGLNRAITVKKDHTRPDTTNYKCEDVVYCQDANCGEKIADAAGHDYEYVYMVPALDEEGNPILDENDLPVMIVDVTKRVNANDCTKISYNHIRCTKPGCGFDTTTMDPADLQKEEFWIDAHKKAANYKAAADDHTPDTDFPFIMVEKDVLDKDGNPVLDKDGNPVKEQVKQYVASCEKNLLCTECGYVIMAAQGHKDYTETFVPATCVANAKHIYTCSRGKDCDRYTADPTNLDAATNVVTWEKVYTLEEYPLSNHKYGVMIDGVYFERPYLSQSVDCLNYAVEVWHCVNCENSEKLSGSYYATNFMDPTGHTLINLGKALHCTEYSWDYWACEDCLPLKKACADPRHNEAACCYAHATATQCLENAEDCYNCTDLLADEMYQTPDWKKELGVKGELNADNTAKEIAPTGHYYVETDLPEGLTINEGVVVAEDGKIYFDMTCIDAIKHGVKYEDENDLDEDGNPKVKYWYPTCDGGCDKTLNPDMHAWDHDDAENGFTFQRPESCTQNGLAWGNCVLCGGKDIVIVIPATGHTDLYWRLAPANNCCEAGKAVLACKECEADVKVGDKLADTIPSLAVTPDETRSFVTPDVVVEGFELTIELPKLDHDFGDVENRVPTDVKPATIHTPGINYYSCLNTFNGHKCEVLHEVEIPKLDAVQFKGSIDNAVAPGNKIYVNGGRIAYTVTIDAEDKDVFGVQFYVEYDANKLSYSNFDFGEAAENIFGGLDATQVGSTVKGDKGYVSVMAYMQPQDADGDGDNELVDFIVNEEHVVVVLYFDILPGTVTDDMLDRGFSTELNIINEEGKDNPYNPIVINTKPDVDDSEEIVFANDHKVAVVNADEIRVEKLGDANVVKNDDGSTKYNDGLVNMHDILTIENLILKSGYDVRADIDQDGDVDVDDVILVQRYIIFATTYAEMVGVVVEDAE